MQKLKLPNLTLEQVFILFAVFTIFVVTVHQMSTDGVLPGNDPAVHLGKAKTIVMDEQVTYSEVAWYPPLFHAILAMLQIFAGTLDVMVAAFILKLIIATLNVLILLSTYLLCRKFFGKGVAVASVVFTILSVPLFEMIFWGGYANFLGLAYIAFIFYIMNREFAVSVKTFLLFLGTFTLVMGHQLSTFVFVLMFFPAFLVSTIGSRRKFIIFFAVVVGGGLALLAWYARIFIEYANIVIEHIFFMMEENVYHIPAVGYNALLKNLGPSLFLALAGIPLTFILLKKKKALKSSILIIFWVAVPFLLAQSHIFGLYLPFHRFIYFFATPIAILSGMVVYYSLATVHNFIESKLIPEITKKRSWLNSAKIFALAIGFTLIFTQAFIFIQRVESYPQFYERASIPSYKSGIWVKQHSVPDGTVVVPRSPGSWFYIFSDHYTMEETDPVYSRNAVAEAVLYSFYEMENTRSLTREYALESSTSGQEIFVSRYNIWTRALKIPNNYVSVIYAEPFSGDLVVPLSETTQRLYWTKKTADESQMIAEYIHELFTVRKVVTFSSQSSVIRMDWKIEAHEDLPIAKLSIVNFMEPSLDYKEALVPGILEWQNPWDNPSFVNAYEDWAVVEGSSDALTEGIVAVLDTKNGILTALEFDNRPDWFVLGALDNLFVDALRLRFELGDLAEGDERQISFSILVHAFEFDDAEHWTVSELKQQFDLQENLPVYERDFQTYIKDYNIKLVVVDTQQVLSNDPVSPALDRIYDNGRSVVYTTKR